MREQQPALRSFSLSDFIAAMFKHCAALRPYSGFADEIYRSFTDYKVKVPTTGAILLNPAMDKVRKGLLQRGVIEILSCLGSVLVWIQCAE